MKRFMFVLILSLLMLAACSPTAKTTPTPALTRVVEQPTPTKPPAVLPTRTLHPTSIPTLQSTAAALGPISLQSAPGLRGTLLTLHGQIWRLIWPQAGTLRVLMQPDATQTAVVMEYDLPSLAPAGRPGSFTSPAALLGMTRDGSQMAYVDDSGRVRLQAADGSSITLPVQGTAYGGAYSPDGKRFVTTSADRWEATVWDTQSGEKLAVMTDFETAAPVYGAYAGYGSTLLWQVRATAQVDDWQSGKNRFKLSYTDFISGWDFSPDGQSLGLAVEGKVRVVDLNSGVERWAQDAPGAYSLAFSPDGSILAAGGSQGIYLWNAQTGALLAKLEADVYYISFSPDGSALAGILNEGGVEVWQ